MRHPRVLLGVVAVGLAALLVPACRTYSNPHGRQDLPHVIRINTEPPGATLTLRRLNLVLTTPADLELVLEADDELVITKEGYVPFRGRLGALEQTALNTYNLKLEPAP